MSLDRTKIAVKYCGGCNSRYDRREAALELEDLLGGPLPVARPGDAYSLIFVLCGCSARCVDLSALTADEFILIDSMAWLEKTKEVLTGFLESDRDHAEMEEPCL